MRALRCLVAAALAVTVTLPTTAAHRPPGLSDGPPPSAGAPIPHLDAGSLAAHYAASRQAFRREAAAARRHDDGDRAARLAALAGQGRHFLTADPRGDGRAVEVIGDLARARRVAILVPGTDTDVSRFDPRDGAAHTTPAGGARAVYREARRVDRDTELAVVAWLGYDPPATLGIDTLRGERAEAGATGLRRLVDQLHESGRVVSLLCHSYGSLVCGAAAERGPVGDLVAFGSPGMGSGAAAMRGTRVWATRSSGDWVGFVPHIEILGFGHGRDPVSPGFGARVFAADGGGHSDYLTPGSASLRAMALIAVGHADEVPVPRDHDGTPEDRR